MSLYDRSELEVLSHHFLVDQDVGHRDGFYAEAFRYAKYLANSKVKPYRKYWESRLDGETPAMDCAVYASECLIAYVEGERFPLDTWAEKPMACLTRFMKNRISDYLRRELQHFSHVETGIDISLDTLSGVKLDLAPNSTYQQAERNMMVGAVEVAMAGLPRNLIDIFELRFGAGLSPRQIAVKKRLPVSEVYPMIARLKSMVRARLDSSLVA